MEIKFEQYPKLTLQDLKIGLEVKLSQLTNISEFICFVIIKRASCNNNNNYNNKDYENIIGKIVYMGNPYEKDEDDIFANWLMDEVEYHAFTFCIMDGVITPIYWEEPRYEEWDPEEDDYEITEEDLEEPGQKGENT